MGNADDRPHLAPPPTLLGCHNLHGDVPPSPVRSRTMAACFNDREGHSASLPMHGILIISTPETKKPVKIRGTRGRGASARGFDTAWRATAKPALLQFSLEGRPPPCIRLPHTPTSPWLLLLLLRPPPPPPPPNVPICMRLAPDGGARRLCDGWWCCVCVCWSGGGCWTPG